MAWGGVQREREREKSFFFFIPPSDGYRFAWRSSSGSSRRAAER